MLLVSGPGHFPSLLAAFLRLVRLRETLARVRLSVEGLRANRSIGLNFERHWEMFAPREP